MTLDKMDQRFFGYLDGMLKSNSEMFENTARWCEEHSDPTKI